MAQYFFLNDLMLDNALDGVDMQDVFEQTMMKYVMLRKEETLDIGSHIIIGHDVENIIIGGLPLKELIFKIENRELKTACINYFLKCVPLNTIDKNYSLDSIEDEIIEEIADIQYSNGQSATNDVIASLMSWILFSFPIVDEWKKTEVAIDSDGKYRITNFYGDNRYDIIDKILAENTSKPANKIRFINRIDKMTIELCPEFEAFFDELTEDEQIHMCNRLYTAWVRNLIQKNGEDDKLYRHCTCTGSKIMFELKSSHDLGIRFYLMNCQNGTLVFGGHSFKSKVKGDKQNNDMVRAFEAIKKYLNNK